MSSPKLYRVNLLPPELAPGPYIERRRLVYIIILTLACGLAGLGVGFFYFQLYVLQHELEATQAEFPALQETVTRVEALRTERQKLEKTSKTWESLLATHTPWRPVLDELARHLPVDMWLTKVEITYEAALAPPKPVTPEGKQPPGPQTPLPKEEPPNTLVLEGASRSVASLGVYVRKLSNLPFFSQVSLNEFREQADETLSFKITCKLKSGDGHEAFPQSP